MTAIASAAIRSSFLHSGRTARRPENRGKRSISVHSGLPDVKGLGIKDCVLIDPSMGSGHILVYGFEVLMQIYTSQGYSERDAARSILENNLYGLDIDDRAFQLAYFAVMMKGRQYDRRIMIRGIRPHVYAIQESNDINWNHVKFLGNRYEGKDEVQKELTRLLDQFQDAKLYGSIIKVERYDFDAMREMIQCTDIASQISLETVGIQETVEKIREIIDITEVMQKKYWVACTNPPYMGSGGMNAKLSKFVKENYADYKSDLFSAFIVRCTEMTLSYGYEGFLSPYVWMFIQSYEKLRKYIYSTRTIQTLIQFEYSAFEEATVPICSFVLKNEPVDLKGIFFRLTDFRGGMEEQRVKTLAAISNHNCGYYYETRANNFQTIPGMPIAFWVSPKGFSAFLAPAFQNRFASAGRNKTHNNELYVRNWWEISDRKRWKPYANGGDYRKWYGNDNDVVDWSPEARQFYHQQGGLIKEKYWNCEAITWNDITSGPSSYRIKRKTSAFSSVSPTIVNKSLTYDYLMLGFLNSVVCKWMNAITNPTLHTLVGNILLLPDKLENNSIEEKLVRSNITLSKSDWNSFETSWDFTVHPLVPYSTSGTLSTAFS